MSRLVVLGLVLLASACGADASTGSFLEAGDSGSDVATQDHAQDHAQDSTGTPDVEPHDGSLADVATQDASSGESGGSGGTHADSGGSGASGGSAGQAGSGGSSGTGGSTGGTGGSGGSTGGAGGSAGAGGADGGSCLVKLSWRPTLCDDAHPNGWGSASWPCSPPSPACVYFPSFQFHWCCPP